MSLTQFESFEYRLSNGHMITIYQLIDDATRYDVGAWAYLHHENSTDAKHLVGQAINKHGAPGELLADKSFAFNQQCRGTIRPVKVIFASRGTMPISGLPGISTTQGKNER